MNTPEPSASARAPQPPSAGRRSPSPRRQVERGRTKVPSATPPAPRRPPVVDRLRRRHLDDHRPGTIPRSSRRRSNLGRAIGIGPWLQAPGDRARRSASGSVSVMTTVNASPATVSRASSPYGGRAALPGQRETNAHRETGQADIRDRGRHVALDHIRRGDGQDLPLRPRPQRWHHGEHQRTECHPRRDRRTAAANRCRTQRSRATGRNPR